MKTKCIDVRVSAFLLSALMVGVACIGGCRPGGLGATAAETVTLENPSGHAAEQMATLSNSTRTWRLRGTLYDEDPFDWWRPWTLLTFKDDVVGEVDISCKATFDAKTGEVGDWTVTFGNWVDGPLKLSGHVESIDAEMDPTSYFVIVAFRLDGQGSRAWRDLSSREVKVGPTFSCNDGGALKSGGGHLAGSARFLVCPKYDERGAVSLEARKVDVGCGADGPENACKLGGGDFQIYIDGLELTGPQEVNP